MKPIASRPYRLYICGIVMLSSALVVLTGCSGCRADRPRPGDRTSSLMDFAAAASFIFNTEHGCFPNSLTDIEKVLDEHKFKEKFPYEGAMGLVDEWGGALWCGLVSNRFVISSSGPDGKLGTEDDLTQSIDRSSSTNGLELYIQWLRKDHL